MQALLFEPFLTRPHSLHTLADAVTAMYADMRTNPTGFGTNQQLHNLHYLVRWASDAVCDVLGKARTEIVLEEILDLDEVLIRHALDEGTDRKHASVYATGCRKIIEYARSRGWSCDAVVRMVAWEPVLQALTGTKDCAVQLVRFLIAAGKTPESTTEADLQSWHAWATDAEHGMLPATADRVLSRFRGRMRLSGLEHLFPHLDLKSKKPTTYRKKKKDWAPSIRAGIEKLVATRAPIYLPGRDHRKALRPASIKSAVDSISALYGCLEDQLKRGPFDCLEEMFTTTNLCDSIDWLRQHGLLRQGVHRILDSILALANQFPNLNSGEVRKRIKQVPREPKHWMHAEKQAKSLPYDALSLIPIELQQLIDAGGLSKLDIAWLLHDKALIATLHELVLRQRNLRECELPSPDVEEPNVVWEPLNPKMLRETVIPDCVREAYDADRSRTREFLMLKFTEKQTKGKRAETEVLSLDLAATMQAFLGVRDWLLEQVNAGKGKPEAYPRTLFFNRAGRAMTEHNLRSHVLRLTRNHAGKSVPPHLWRDIFAAQFRVLLATGVEVNPGRLPRKLWHVDQPTTDKYSHLDRAWAAIAMRNQRYRASHPPQRKESSEQLAQPAPRQERAA